MLESYMGKALNPIFDLTLEQVIEVSVEGFFAKVSKFKTINNHLHLETWRKFINLYVKICGTTKPSNNELMFWVVKGYITEVKGFKINWAKVVACIVREKARNETMEKMMKLQASKVNGSELSCKSKGDAPWKRPKSTKLHPRGVQCHMVFHQWI